MKRKLFHMFFFVFLFLVTLVPWFMGIPKEKKVLLSLSEFYALSPLFVWLLRELFSEKISQPIKEAFVFAYITFLGLSCAFFAFFGANNNPKEVYESFLEWFEVPVFGSLGTFLILIFVLSPKLRKYAD
ncbi:hypothetical protein CLV27_0732 [Phorcysia thermohydrogeniphila]|uniref:Uncharacterized protein n=1 Tax=Phorcysia thermohydrogeniphila TaxID=936138 RepID=A0A4R1GF67_9BACT|nr:hypothetical protein CLV27_0732 [Phorcysia thermohydrogeniphila]